MKKKRKGENKNSKQTRKRKIIYNINKMNV